MKTKKIYGSIKASNVDIIEKNNLNFILIISNKLRNYLTSKSEELLPKETSSLLSGILIGDKSNISEETIQDFKTSNLSHILAVSGLHTSYIIFGITLILSKCNFW